MVVAWAPGRLGWGAGGGRQGQDCYSISTAAATSARLSTPGCKRCPTGEGPQHPLTGCSVDTLSAAGVTAVIIHSVTDSDGESPRPLSQVRGNSGWKETGMASPSGSFQSGGRDKHSNCTQWKELERKEGVAGRGRTVFKREGQEGLCDEAMFG